MIQKNQEKILIADDEESVLIGLKALLSEEGYSVTSAKDGRQTMSKLKKEPVSLLLADLDMPHLGGLEILNAIQKLGLTTQVIIVTGKGTIDTAVEAMRSGAYDYLTKPIEPDRLRSIIPKALEHHRLLVSHQDLQRRLKQLTHYDDLVGQSPLMQEIYKMIDAVADSTATILITGESGTGKELVARAMHNKSSRSDKPFIPVNCAALPRDLLENELFGHEKGAFTGATNIKQGCFELAHTGTLFLDEVGEMSPETQVKILRALEERRFRRLGGKKEIEVDVRVIAATNTDLKKGIDERTFREDLYYRICVVELFLPPLRERVEDIPLLAEEFFNYYREQNKKDLKGIAAACMEALVRYTWPGNVRELKNVVERTVLLCSGEYLQLMDLPQKISASRKYPVMNIKAGTSLSDVEKSVILHTLEITDYNKTHAAKILGISLKTLHNKLNKYKK